MSPMPGWRMTVRSSYATFHSGCTQRYRRVAASFLAIGGQDKCAGAACGWGFQRQRIPWRRILKQVEGLFNEGWGPYWRKADAEFWKEFEEKCVGPGKEA
jgi:hypothetical protein